MWLVHNFPILSLIFWGLLRLAFVWILNAKPQVPETFFIFGIQVNWSSLECDVFLRTRNRLAYFGGTDILRQFDLEEWKQKVKQLPCPFIADFQTPGLKAQFFNMAVKLESKDGRLSPESW